MNRSLWGIKPLATGNSGRVRGTPEKRKFPRLPVTKPAICFRYGKQMSMRTIDISLGGLKLEANFDLAIGESIDFAILTNGTRIRCKGRILGIEDLKNKVHARLRFAQISDMDFQKLANYLDNLSREKGMPFQRVVISGLLILVALIAYLIIRAYFLR
jgi:hypothetical protein